ncbi:hypothetical protein BZA77DRAFT_301054 [Pyronema omphalodes]|nr:hypothetical protein BZA77DRAFT_301054 [Pyronema omphalodes]
MSCLSALLSLSIRVSRVTIIGRYPMPTYKSYKHRPGSLVSVLFFNGHGAFGYEVPTTDWDFLPIHERYYS